MGLFSWAGQNWFTLLQSSGIVGGLIFTAVSFRVDARSRRVDHLITLNEHYRQIWSEIFARPELNRIMSESVGQTPIQVSREEDLLVRMLIFHLNNVYRSHKIGVVVKIDGMEKDIQWFLSLPIPRTVWEQLKSFQDADFVRFVESCLSEKPAKS